MGSTSSLSASFVHSDAMEPPTSVSQHIVIAVKFLRKNLAEKDKHLIAELRSKLPSNGETTCRLP